MKNRYMPPLLEKMFTIAISDDLTPQKIDEMKSLLELLPRVVELRQKEIEVYKAMQASKLKLDLKIPEEISIDIKDKGNDTLLSWAAYRGHGALVRILIDAKANVDTLHEGGTTALIFAAVKGKTEVAQTLIDAKADIHIQHRNGSTALLEAIRNRHPEIVHKLIDAEEKLGLGIHQTKKMLAQYIDENINYIHLPMIHLFLDRNVSLTKETSIKLFHYLVECNFTDPVVLRIITILCQQHKAFPESDKDNPDKMGKLIALNGLYKKKTFDTLEIAIGNYFPNVLVDLMNDYDNPLERVDIDCIRNIKSNTDNMEKKPSCNIM